MGFFDKIMDLLTHREVKTPAEKIGRNEPCPCGSGKKYKNCHLHEDEKRTRTYVSCGKS